METIHDLENMDIDDEEKYEINEDSFSCNNGCDSKRNELEDDEIYNKSTDLKTKYYEYANRGDEEYKMNSTEAMNPNEQLNFLEPHQDFLNKTFTNSHSGDFVSSSSGKNKENNNVIKNNSSENYIKNINDNVINHNNVICLDLKNKESCKNDQKMNTNINNNSIENIIINIIINNNNQDKNSNNSIPLASKKMVSNSSSSEIIGFKDIEKRLEGTEHEFKNNAEIEAREEKIKEDMHRNKKGRVKNSADNIHTKAQRWIINYSLLKLMNLTLEKKKLR